MFFEKTLRKYLVSILGDGVTAPLLSMSSIIKFKKLGSKIEYSILLVTQNFITRVWSCIFLVGTLLWFLLFLQQCESKDPPYFVGFVGDIAVIFVIVVVVNGGK